MNEIGVAVHLLLALTVAVGAWTTFSTSRPARKVAAPIRKAKSTTVRTQTPPPTVAKAVEKAQRPRPRAAHRNALPWTVPQDHALPWVIPTALAPAAAYNENNKTTITVKELCERLVAIESRLDRISRHAVR